MFLFNPGPLGHAADPLKPVSLAGDATTWYPTALLFVLRKGDKRNWQPQRTQNPPVLSTLGVQLPLPAHHQSRVGRGSQSDSKVERSSKAKPEKWACDAGVTGTGRNQEESRPDAGALQNAVTSLFKDGGSKPEHEILGALRLHCVNMDLRTQRWAFVLACFLLP